MELTRTKAPLVALAAASVLTLGACTKTEEYTVGGALIGGTTGALIASGGAVAAGAAIGGVAGAAAGYLIAKSHYEENQF